VGPRLGVGRWALLATLVAKGIQVVEKARGYDFEVQTAISVGH
jgi:hypothetical protein